jgi:hypothetical protein
MLLQNYRPLPQLVTKTTRIKKPRFPVIDAHNHLAAPYGGAWDEKPLSELLDVFDEADIRMFVDLDGGWGETLLQKHLDFFKAKAPERFQIFGGVDWAQWQTLGTRFPEWAAGRLKVQKGWGAQGLKIWKPFGLNVRDEKGELVKIDDSRLDLLWQTAGELGLPVMIHIADPVAFFYPRVERHERWDELSAHPEAHFPSPPFPSFEELIEAFANLVTRHPSTVFVGAHVGCYAENLGWVASLIQRTQNFYVDISARIPELGRQPYSARRFFVENQDRILFGTDHPANAETYRAHYRFLESDDEYFAYDADPEAVPGQGRWRIYGLYLPDDVLKKIYWENAAKVYQWQPLDH